MGEKTLKSKEAFFPIEFEVFTCEWVKKNLRSTFHLDLRCLPVSGSPLPAWDSWPSISIDCCISRANDTCPAQLIFAHKFKQNKPKKIEQINQIGQNISSKIIKVDPWLLHKLHNKLKNLSPQKTQEKINQNEQQKKGKLS